MQHTNNEKGEAPSGPPPTKVEGSQVPLPTNSGTTPQTTGHLSKKARRKASMIKWRLEKQQQHEQHQDSASSFNFELEGEEEDFYRLKNNERSKYPWNRPQSNFSTRARWTTLETRLNQRWQEAGLGVPEQKEGKKPFVILDGPPYANGSIHLGHVLNKVLKDAICKYKRMTGHAVEYKVGWDCHGLPIEKLLSGEEKLKEDSELQETLNLIRKCKAHATKWVDKQKQSFRKLGVLADFDNAFCTYDPSYQASIVRAFAKFVEQGYIEHNQRPVPWCVSCQTVLAHAEISHLNIEDPSCYVFFPCAESSTMLDLFLQSDPETLAFEKEKAKKVGFLVWTTSPWSLPLNRGIAINPSLDYCLIALTNGDPLKRMLFVVAKDCVPTLRESLNAIKAHRVDILGQPIKATVLTSQIKKIGHPIIENFEVPIVLHPKVSAKIGTAILHVAPGCCEEDYLLGKEYGLEICCTIDENGRFTDEIKIDGLKGLSVPEANVWVLDFLISKGNLVLKSGEVCHTSPHCWRCNSPLLFRMTKQWFINLDKNNLFDQAQKEVKKNSVSFYPPKSKTPFLTTVACRPHEWCISRQRKWGVPIPAIICGDCGQGFTSPAFALKIADLLEAHGGIEFYWEQMASCRSFAELRDRFFSLEDKDSEKFICPHCGHNALDEKPEDEGLCFKKTGSRLEKDIFDVWFDSGVASFAVKTSVSSSSASPSPSPPLQMLCEGQDQHRGWYQALLFCSLVLQGQVPSSSFLTHSFVVGQDKKKLSKSSMPKEEETQQPQSQPRIHIQFHDTVVGRKPDDFCGDMLRLWACSSKYSTNVIMSDELYRTLRKKYMLLRHTSWFILANISDFSEEDALGFDVNMLFPYDKFTLSVLHRLETKVHQAYESYDFATVCTLLLDYLQKDLRPLYLINAKSRLYFDKPDSPLRRSAQFALWKIITVMSQLWAPILSFYAEQVNDDLVSRSKQMTSSSPAMQSSIHLQQFKRTEEPLKTKKEKCCWISLEKLRKLVAAEVEAKRKENVFSRNEYAKVDIQLILPEKEEVEQPKQQKPKASKNNKNKDEEKFDDDCLNIKLFLEDFATEEESNAFLCSYFNISQCRLEFVLADHQAKEGGDGQDKKKKKKEKEKAKKNKKEETQGGAALKERAKIAASHASGKLCCRCDVYYNDDEEITKEEKEEQHQHEGSEKKEKEKEKKAHLGVCNRCKAQLA